VERGQERVSAADPRRKKLGAAQRAGAAAFLIARQESHWHVDAPLC
jgi:hypothetical protein